MAILVRYSYLECFLDYRTQATMSKIKTTAAFNNKVNSRHVIRIDDTAIGDDAQV